MSTTCPETRRAAAYGRNGGLTGTAPVVVGRMRGSALIVAVFLLVALAALGAFIAGIGSSQHVGSAHDLQGARAYQAARYGSEWGVYQVLRGDPADSGHVAALSCATAGTFCNLCRSATYTAAHRQDLTGLAAPLDTFRVSVYCGTGATTHTEGGSTDIRVYQITAVACNQPDAGACPNTTAAAVTSIGYIERRISLTVTN